jgi:hypothetical protein
VDDVGDVRGAGRVESQAVPVGDLDRARVDPRGGPGAGRRDVSADPVAPERGGELGAGRVVGADEHHPVRVAHRWRGQCGEGAGLQPQVGAAPVTLGPGARDQAGVLQHLHVVGDQVGRHREVVGDLAG